MGFGEGLGWILGFLSTFFSADRLANFTLHLFLVSSGAPHDSQDTTGMGLKFRARCINSMLLQSYETF
eukprot:6206517-Amphidinium_carterae.1